MTQSKIEKENKIYRELLSKDILEMEYDELRFYTINRIKPAHSDRTSDENEFCEGFVNRW